MAVTEEKNVTHIYVRVCYCDQNSYFLPKMGDIFFKEGCKLCFRVAKLLSDMSICLGLFPQTSPGKKEKKNETKWLVPDKLSIALFRGVYTSPDCGSHICNKTCQSTKQISFKLSKKDIFGYLNST